MKIVDDPEHPNSTCVLPKMIWTKLEVTYVASVLFGRFQGHFVVVKVASALFSRFQGYFVVGNESMALYKGNEPMALALYKGMAQWPYTRE